jgi:hypothetical protein
VDPHRADLETRARELAVVRQQKGTKLKWATLATYVNHLRAYEAYLEARPGGGHLLLNPRVMPRARETWPSTAERETDPMLHFNRHPISIDFRPETFDLVTFQCWLTEKCKTPKENGKFHSWKRNSKVTCSLKWAMRHASFITLGRYADQSVPDKLDEDMDGVKASLGEYACVPACLLACLPAYLTT